MKLPAPAGVTAVMFSATAAGSAGTSQFVALPPCVVKPPAPTQTLKSRDELLPIAPPASRVSATRHGVTGVYTRSSAPSPSDLVCSKLALTEAVDVSDSAITLRSPSRFPAR